MADAVRTVIGLGQKPKRLTTSTESKVRYVIYVILVILSLRVLKNY